ncbi:MAG TPA: Atu4866 domain-containing protein [Bosea sp. (in: a-proteobacteria)]
MPRNPITTSLVATALIAGSLAGTSVPAQVPAPHPYVGMWVTADGHVRHELLPNGRYDEARGNRRHAYQGRYTITGDHIDYVDDTGFTADGDFIDGVLHHGGMVLRRER